MAISGQLDEPTLSALRNIGPQATVDANTYLNLYVSVPLNTDRFLTIRDNTVKPASPAPPSQAASPAKPPVDVPAPAAAASLATALPQTSTPQVKPTPVPAKKAETAESVVRYDKVISMLSSLGLNATPASLSLWMDQNQFLIGDRIRYYFKADNDCHVVIIGLTTDNKVVQLFPNRYQTQPLVHAGQVYVIVDDSAEMALEVTGPAGQEEVIAFISDRPFELFPSDFSRQPFVELSDSADGLKKVSSRIQAAQNLNISQKRIRYHIVNR